MKRSPIRKWRLKRGLTQQELADKSGIGRVTIALLEKGGYRRRGPYPSTIRKLAKVLKVKPQEIEF